MEPRNGQKSFNEMLVAELHYIRQRVELIYDRHYLLYAKVAGISALISAAAVLVGWVAQQTTAV